MTIRGTIAPTPVLALAGADVAAGPHPDGSWPDLMALDGAVVKWGRAKVLDQPAPATATVRIFDPSRVWAAGRDLVGSPVELRWACTGTERVYFTGRVAAVEVERHKVRDPDGNTVRGTLVTMSCTSLLVDLGNRALLRFRESIAVRRAALAAAAAGPVAAVTPPATWDDAVVFYTGETTVLDALGRLFDACGAARFTYDPHTRTVATVERRAFADAAPLARLSRDAARVGVFIAAPGGWIDTAAVVGKDTASKDLESRLTRVQVGYLTLNEAADGLEPATLSVPIAGADESLTGERVVSIDTGLTALNWASTAAAQLADLAANEAAGWTLQPMRWDTARTGGGFETIEQATALLAGTETPGVLFLARSALPDLGIRPVFGVMGGAIGYRAGAWSVEWTPAPIKAPPPPPPLAWEDLDPALTWQRNSPHGLHESVTYEDMAFVADGAVHERSA